jgi:hypothetical protein
LASSMARGGGSGTAGAGAGADRPRLEISPQRFAGGTAQAHSTDADAARLTKKEGRHGREMDAWVACAACDPCLLCRINTGWAGSLTRGPWAWVGPRRGFFVRTKSGKGLGDASDRGGGPWPSGLRDPRGRALGPSWPWARGCRPPSSRRRRAGEATTGCTGEGHKRLASELQLPADPVRLVRLAYQPPASDTFLS